MTPERAASELAPCVKADVLCLTAEQWLCGLPAAGRGAGRR